jgi:multiple sugar transport system permease protein
LPIPPHFENLIDVLMDPTAPLVNGLRNSAFVALCRVSGQLLISSLAGYGLARVPFRWRDQVFYLILTTLMIPTIVTYVPTYVVVARMGWVNTFQGIIVPGIFGAFNTFLFRQFYLDFPKEVEEAGFMDGLGYLGTYWYLALPNSIGIFVSLGVVSFINTWNEFAWPLMIGQEASMWTVQVVLSTFITAQTVNLPGLFMGAAISTLPVLIVFLILQQHLVERILSSPRISSI